MLVKVKVIRSTEDGGTTQLSSLISVLAGSPLSSQYQVIADRVNLTNLDKYTVWELVGGVNGTAGRQFQDGDTLSSFGLKNGAIILIKPSEPASDNPPETTNNLHKDSHVEAATFATTLASEKSTSGDRLKDSAGARPASVGQSGHSELGGPEGDSLHRPTSPSGSSSRRDTMTYPATGPQTPRSHAGSDSPRRRDSAKTRLSGNYDSDTIYKGKAALARQRAEGVKIERGDLENSLEEQIFGSQMLTRSTRVLMAVKVYLTRRKKKRRMVIAVARNWCGAYAMFVIKMQGWRGHKFSVERGIPLVESFGITGETSHKDSFNFLLDIDGIGGSSFDIVCSYRAKELLQKALTMAYECMYPSTLTDLQVQGHRMESVKFASEFTTRTDLEPKEGAQNVINGQIIPAADLRYMTWRTHFIFALLEQMESGQLESRELYHSVAALQHMAKYPVVVDPRPIIPVAKRVFARALSFDRQMTAEGESFLAHLRLMEALEEWESASIPFPEEFFAVAPQATSSTTLFFSADTDTVDPGTADEYSANNTSAVDSVGSTSIAPSGGPSTPGRRRARRTSSVVGDNWMAGTYLAALFYTDDGQILLDDGKNLPSVYLFRRSQYSLDESSADFMWLMEFGSRLPDRTTHKLSDGRDAFPFRTQFVEGLRKLRAQLGDLGLLYDSPVFLETTRTTLLVVANKVSAQKKFYGDSQLTWHPMNDVELQLYRRYLDMPLLTDLDELDGSINGPRWVHSVVKYHSSITTVRHDPGVRLGYFMFKSEPDGFYVCVPDDDRNMIPSVSIQEQPLSTSAWWWVRGARLSTERQVDLEQDKLTQAFSDRFHDAIETLQDQLDVDDLGQLMDMEYINLDEHNTMQMIVFVDVCKTSELPESLQDGYIWKKLDLFEVHHYSVYAEKRYREYADGTLQLKQQIAQLPIIPPAESPADQAKERCHADKLRRDLGRKERCWLPMRWPLRAINWALNGMHSVTDLVPNPGLKSVEQILDEVGTQTGIPTVSLMRTEITNDLSREWSVVEQRLLARTDPDTNHRALDRYHARVEARRAHLVAEVGKQKTFGQQQRNAIKAERNAKAVAEREQAAERDNAISAAAAAAAIPSESALTTSNSTDDLLSPQAQQSLHVAQTSRESFALAAKPPPPPVDPEHPAAVEAFCLLLTDEIVESVLVDKVDQDRTDTCIDVIDSLISRLEQDHVNELKQHVATAVQSHYELNKLDLAREEARQKHEEDLEDSVPTIVMSEGLKSLQVRRQPSPFTPHITQAALAYSTLVSMADAVFRGLDDLADLQSLLATVDEASVLKKTVKRKGTKTPKGQRKSVAKKRTTNSNSEMATPQKGAAAVHLSESVARAFAQDVGNEATPTPQTRVTTAGTPRTDGGLAQLSVYIDEALAMTTSPNYAAHRPASRSNVKGPLTNSQRRRSIQSSTTSMSAGPGMNSSASTNGSRPRRTRAATVSTAARRPSLNGSSKGVSAAQRASIAREVAANAAPARIARRGSFSNPTSVPFASGLGNKSRTSSVGNRSVNSSLSTGNRSHGNALGTSTRVADTPAYFSMNDGRQRSQSAAPVSMDSSRRAPAQDDPDAAPPSLFDIAMQNQAKRNNLKQKRREELERAAAIGRSRASRQ